MNEEMNAPMASHLMEAKIKVNRNKECKVEVKRLVDFNDESMICGYEFNTDACQVMSENFWKMLIVDFAFTGRFWWTFLH